MTMKERIIEAIEKLSHDEAISLWQNYCNESNRMDDNIYSMEEFDEIMEGMKPWDVARTCYYSGNFCPAHDYFWFKEGKSNVYHYRTKQKWQLHFQRLYQTYLLRLFLGISVHSTKNLGHFGGLNHNTSLLQFKNHLHLGNSQLLHPFTNLFHGFVTSLSGAK